MNTHGVHRATAVITGALTCVVAAAGPGRADPVELVRAAHGQVERGQLALDLASQVLRAMAGEASLAELITSQLATTGEGAALLMMLYSNAPKAVVVDLTATAGAGSSGRDGAIAGELTATLTARVAGDFCDIAFIGASVRGGGGSSGETVAGESRVNAGFCFWRGLFIGPDATRDGFQGYSAALFPLRMNAGLAVNAQSRWSSLRNQPRRRYSEAGYGFSVDGMRVMPSDPQRGVTFLYFAAEQRWEWPGLFDGDRGFELDAGFGFFRLFRMRDAHAIADRAIDIIDIELHGTKFDESVALIDLYPVKFRGIGLGSNRVLADAWFGLTSSGGTITSSDCIDGVGCVDEVITTGPNVEDVTTWAARAGISIGTRAQGAGAYFARRLDSNILGQLAVENRGTAWSQRIDGPVFVRGEVFGGTAIHYLDIDARGRERFAGGSLDASYEVSDGLRIGAQLDGIAVWDRDAVLDRRVAGSGVRAFATLSWTTSLFHRGVALPAMPAALTAPGVPTASR